MPGRYDSTPTTDGEGYSMGGLKPKTEGINLERRKTDKGLFEYRRVDGKAAVEICTREERHSKDEEPRTEYIINIARTPDENNDHGTQRDGGQIQILAAKTKEGAKLVMAVAIHELEVSHASFNSISKKMSDFSSNLREAESLADIHKDKIK